MGFKENLKARLQYSNILVKELAALTGIKKPTLDSYLRAGGYTPSVDAGVKIARALGVSVEYLVTGQDGQGPCSSPEARLILTIADELNPGDRYKLLEIAKIFKRTG